jgi:hypothetical protein
VLVIFLKKAEIMDYTFKGRYSGELEDLLDELKAVKELRVDFDNDYQGHVDVDVLLEDGKVFSYKYYYGSCSGCDSWEGDDLTGDEIKIEMLKEATIFDNESQYQVWRKSIK